MRKKNYYTGGYTGSFDVSNSVIFGNKPFSSGFGGGSGSNTGNTNTAGGTADDKKNKGEFWKNLANVAGGLFGGGGNNQQQQTYVPQEAPKDKPNYGLIIGIIVAVIAVGVGIYFMTKK